MAEEHALVQLARKTIDTYVRTGRRIRLEDAPESIEGEPAGAFVTLHSASSRGLRGCIGTIQPTESSLTRRRSSTMRFPLLTRDPASPP